MQYYHTKNGATKYKNLPTTLDEFIKELENKVARRLKTVDGIKSEKDK